MELYSDKNWLTEQYWGFNLAMSELAKLTDCCEDTIYRWMKKHNIPTRTVSERMKNNNPMKNPIVAKKISDIRIGKSLSEEAKRKLSEHFSQPHIVKIYSERMMGKNNPSWCGGHSIKYGPEFDRKLRREIRDRDSHICQLCLCEENGRALAIHHIDYDKLNNNPLNLIATCCSCHTNTQFNREMWIELCEDIVLAKYYFPIGTSIQRRLS